jgi:DNA repair protein RadC
MSIRSWPTKERPREKLLAHGAESLSDAELLAIFLRTGVKGKSALGIARDLINEYGDIRQLLEAKYADVIEKRGMGPSKFVQLQAALELGRRFLACKLANRELIRDTADCITYLQHRLRHRHNEIFAIIYLTSKNQIIDYEELFEGSINYSQVYPRTIIAKILAKNASSVIFSHNHPSGDPKPSQADVSLTKRLYHLLNEIDVNLLDHIIIGDDTVSSLKQLGLF